MLRCFGAVVCVGSGGIDDCAGGIRDNQLSQLNGCGLVNGGRNGLLIHGIYLSQGCCGDVCFTAEGFLLGLVKQSTTGCRTVQDQEGQCQKGNANIGHGITKLASAVFQKFRFYGSNSQRPISSKCTGDQPDFLPAFPANGEYVHPQYGYHYGIHTPK